VCRGNATPAVAPHFPVARDHPSRDRVGFFIPPHCDCSIKEQHYFTPSADLRSAFIGQEAARIGRLKKSELVDAVLEQDAAVFCQVVRSAPRHYPASLSNENPTFEHPPFGANRSQMGLASSNIAGTSPEAAAQAGRTREASNRDKRGNRNF
jgi:hypothetical protein